MPAMVDLRNVKRTATEGYPPGHPGREAILVQPDELEQTTFDALLPSLLKLLRIRT